MNAVSAKCLSQVELGEIREFRNMAIFPMFCPLGPGPAYLVMKEALEKGLLCISEVGGGAVPTLRAVNRADSPVLLLDGEELAGAKQNRVLNTTILLKERSATDIPVSCTEQGRWSYVAPDFRDSGVVMNCCSRAAKCSSVTESLRGERCFRSDQERVWGDIFALAADAGVRTATGAMKDVYESRRADLGDYLAAFPPAPGQKGLLAFINGEAAGFDIVSRESAFTALHAKLVKSYAMDALLRRHGNGPATPEKARAFLAQAQSARDEAYPSIGHGTDCRFFAGSLVGSALVYLDTVIHMAFFRRAEGEKLSGDDEGPIADSPRRRDYRRPN